MIYLAQGGYLLLILLIPLMFMAYWLMRRIRRKRLARFGDPELVALLTPEVPRRKGWAKLTLLSIALFFFCIGMARPQIGATLKERQIKGAEIMVVLDVSNSMLAEDYSPNRLERAKLAISKLVDELQGDRIGLIIFAGESPASPSSSCPSLPTTSRPRYSSTRLPPSPCPCRERPWARPSGPPSAVSPPRASTAGPSS